MVTVAAGLNQPYMDAQGRVWVKNGADKRHVTSREEMQRMFLNAGLIQANTLPVPGTSVADVDWAAFDAYYRKRFNQPCPEAEHTASLTSLGLLKDQQCTLAGVLPFGLKPQRWLPVCMVKAVAFYGNSIGDTQYQDSEDIDGTLERSSFSAVLPLSNVTCTTCKTAGALTPWASWKCRPSRWKSCWSTP